MEGEHQAQMTVLLAAGQAELDEILAAHTLSHKSSKP
jgi:hypothetical protein